MPIPSGRSPKVAISASVAKVTPDAGFGVSLNGGSSSSGVSSTAGAVIVNEKLSLKVKEALGNINALPENFAQKELLTKGDGFDFAMIKTLTDKNIDGYLGFALD